MALTEAALAGSLAAGHVVRDDDFDAHLEPEHRGPSDLHWTPVAVAAMAAKWLARAGARDVVDVGSGVGKFCVVAALCAPTLRLVGIEQRAPLVAAARTLSARFDLRRRVFFAHSVARTTQLAGFDAMYLFNPFGENVLPATAHLDASVELSAARMQRDVQVVEQAFDAMSVGGVLLTYHGFGGRVPDSFELTQQEPIESDRLRMWTKRRPAPRGGFWIDIGTDLVLCAQVPTHVASDINARHAQSFASRHGSAEPTDPAPLRPRLRR